MKAAKVKYVPIKVSDLTVHPVAQRDVNENKITEFNKNLNLDAIGVLHAVRYARQGVTGKTYVVDGQHRLRTLERAGLSDYEVMVAIHQDVTNDKQAADLFLDLNNKTNVAAYDRFTKGVVAGYDDETHINDVVVAHGLRVAPQYGPSTVCCISTLYKLNKWGVLDTVLGWVNAAWGKQSSSHEGKILEGLGIVRHSTNGNLDEPSLLKKLSRYPGGANGLLSDAKGRKRYEGGSLAHCVALATCSEYNKGRRDGHIEIKKAGR